MSNNISDQEQLLDVKVLSVNKDYFEGLAKSVSAANKTGAFDILPGHHKFITLLEKSTLRIIDNENNKKTIDITGGLLRVKDDGVAVFLDL